MKTGARGPEHLFLQSGFASAAALVDLNSLDVCTPWGVALSIFR